MFSTEKKTYIKHHEYNATTRANDIGLIKMAKKVHLIGKIIGACLSTDDDDEISEELIAAGWGSGDGTR